jgi:methylglutaconyl-CoA hydratase
MPNPIADPLVEGPDTDLDTRLVRLDATAEGVAFVTIARPAVRNALNGEVIAALREAFETLEGADGVRIAFIRGSGGTFCAGADLEWMSEAIDHTEEDNRADAMTLAVMLKHLYDLPMLTVALVEGAAFGGGAGLAAACDMAIATADARFAFSEAKLGLAAATISPYVIEAIGARRARGLFALGRAFDAATALRFGLVDEVVADSEALGAAAEALAGEARAAGPVAVAESKRLVAHVAGRPIDHALMTETAHRIARIRVSEEGQEGVRAFLERRPPDWLA